MINENYADVESRSSSYYRIATVLKHLGEVWPSRLSLADCADFAGLSPSHFQREFTRWAGVSPKQYHSACTHVEAGRMLRQGASNDEASFETGLSGSGRLHDLFIAHEALSPGEAKTSGANVDLTIGKADTPFGLGVFLISPRGLCGLGFADIQPEAKSSFVHPGYSENQVFSDLSSRYPNAEITRNDQTARQWAKRIFESAERIGIALFGSKFRRQIWRALLEIPPGQISTYQDLAIEAGNTKAARAAGAAVGANPIAWLIPCHRVLAADRRLHNYHWGIDRKRAMLAYEFIGTTK